MKNNYMTFPRHLLLSFDLTTTAEEALELGMSNYVRRCVVKTPTNYMYRFKSVKSSLRNFCGHMWQM